jgi:hypothetical protein
MVVYGYSLKNKKKLLEMKEVTFQVSQKEAQQLADFFSKCATEMTKPNWDHEHFNGGNIPDVIVLISHHGE